MPPPPPDVGIGSRGSKVSDESAQGRVYREATARCYKRADASPCMAKPRAPDQLADEAQREQLRELPPGDRGLVGEIELLEGLLQRPEGARAN